MIFEAAKRNDAFAVTLVEEASTRLGLKVAYLTNFFNPEVVVLGGGVERGGELVLNVVRRVVKQLAMEEASGVVKIILSRLGEDRRGLRGRVPRNAGTFFRGLTWPFPREDCSTRPNSTITRKRTSRSFDTIRKKGPIARAEISRLIGLNIVTVTSYVDQYIKKGVIKEVGSTFRAAGANRPWWTSIPRRST